MTIFRLIHRRSSIPPLPPPLPLFSIILHSFPSLLLPYLPLLLILLMTHLTFTTISLAICPFFSKFSLFLICFCSSALSEPCPFFGDYQCPEDFRCVFDKCQDEQGIEPSNDCAKVKCGKESECRQGKCVLYAGRPCGRNVLVAEGLARAVVSDCGPQGKCIGGRCAIDRCAELICDEMSELCRDGLCLPLSTMFCFSPFDCGPPSLFECRQNKCQRRRDTISPVFSASAQKCDPGETLSGDKCVTQEGCAQLVCPYGQNCFNGFCVPTSGANCANSGECSEMNICREGRCVSDICKANGGRCLPENACSPMSVPEGECRPYQGIPCSHSAAAEDCPPPYFCIGGICSKDECFRKVCQIGERCDGGLCIRVEGNGCRDALRECGEHFDCVVGHCKDRIRAYTEGTNRTTMAKTDMTTAVGGGGTFGSGK